MSVLASNSGPGAQRAAEPNQERAIKTTIRKENWGHFKGGEIVEDVKQIASDALSSGTCRRLGTKSEDCLRPRNERECVKAQSGEREEEETRRDKIRKTESYWSAGSEPDDYEEDVLLVVPSADCVPCVTDDEAHYISTHEIQLSELSDQESDYDLGSGSSASWDVGDGDQVCSFVDYASLDGDKVPDESRGGQQPRVQGEAAAVSILRENHSWDADKFSSAQQKRGSGTSAGQIHLSIKTTSRAINKPGNIHEKEKILYHSTHSGDMSRYVLRGLDGRAESLCDGAKCFIAAPGRIHFGQKLRGKEATGFSSGESSAVSELDDADKEVRNLTAKAFKSLSYPYFDAFNFSTSSESSGSDHSIGINQWSTIVDLKYGNMNMSHGLDQSVVSHQNSTASFEFAKNIDQRGYKGIIKPPTNKIFRLNAKPHSASSGQIELMGEFSQGHRGFIRLTETLNFRCNVKSGMSEGERHTDFAQNAVGSCSMDEVTDTVQHRHRRGTNLLHCKAMEDTHKKAVFASSVIKNVISKKMQFEQERRMERGEISEPHQTPCPCFVHQGNNHRAKGSMELHRQSSKLLECSSDYTIMCVDELGDIVDSGSCGTRTDSRGQDRVAPLPETNLELSNEAGIDTKKGTLEASKSRLLHSQNSAFRCWKDEEVEFQKGHKSDQTQEGKPALTGVREGEGDRHSSCSSKLTKMSHLFVPSIQLLPSDGEVGQQLQSRNSLPCGNSEGMKLHTGNTLYIADSGSVATSKSPEIKINLRSIRNGKTEPFVSSKLRTQNRGCNTASLIRTEDFKCQALAATLKGESSDKVPHFTVRDIRDNKGKLQTPIHQVRDVRKLVKSSYHFVSLDNNENKPNCTIADSLSEQKKQSSRRNPNSVSPIIIKYQSVNTNDKEKQSVNPSDLSYREPLDIERHRQFPEGQKCNTLQSAAGIVPPSSNSFEGDTGLCCDGRIPLKWQEKTSDFTEKKPESKITNQVALEKLQAAVKTMEQLYVFEKNEWRRKTEHKPPTGSHALSLVAKESHGGFEEEGACMENTKPAVRVHPTNTLKGEKDKLLLNTGSCDARLATKLKQAVTNTIGNRNALSLSLGPKPSVAEKKPQPTHLPSCTNNYVAKSPKLFASSICNQTQSTGCEGAQSKELEKLTQEPTSCLVDNENYITIPVKSHASSVKDAPSLDKTPVCMGLSSTGQKDCSQSPKHSCNVVETCSPEIPSATIYHSLPLGMATNQSQVYCFSPAVTPAPTLDSVQAMQKRMLLDPITGNYYLVDTPVQPATKRLFDPETGQYVNVPMPQPPPTPVPLALSPLAFSAGTYGHAYVIYPGYMPMPSVIPPRTMVPSQLLLQSEGECAEKVSSQQTEDMYMDTGKPPQAASGGPQQTDTNRPQQTFSSATRPIISITAQQGPRIITTPSFDGTTMSFVVEHG